MGSSKRGMKDVILKHALKNAFDFDGNVNRNVVLGAVLKENPERKKDVSSVIREVEEVIKHVEKLSPQQIKEQLQTRAPELLQEKKETTQGPLKPLPDATPGKVVMRIAPSPSGALHIGHAYGASLNYEYARMYKGKLILRIEDTNPENIYDKAYGLIEDDVRWLTDGNVAKIIIQSSRLGIYYDHAEKLVQQGNAYVCTCNADHWRELKNDGKACICRSLDKKEQALRYAKMFNEYAEGEAVLRLKTDIRHKNPAMRDFAIMRINEHLHPRTGKEQRVWPLMVFSVAIDDHELGITHVLNGKDQADNARKEMMIMDCFRWKHPYYQHWGRINFQGFRLSASETRQAIEQNEYTGWDDIRLPFLPALRKRGYQPEAFRKYAIEIGLSLNDKTVSREEFWKSINAFNKELVDSLANRYFFVDDPVEITIEGAPARTVGIDLHPDAPQRGKRIFATTDTFYISLSDFKKLGEGYIHRLMDCCNVMLKGKKFFYVSEPYEEYKSANTRGMIIHWLPSTGIVDVEAVLENGTKVEGKGEEMMKGLNSGDLIQLERRYFARVQDNKKDKIVVWYLHA